MIKRLLLGKDWWLIKVEFIAYFHTDNSWEEIENMYKELYNSFDTQGLHLNFERPIEIFKAQLDDETHYQSTFQLRLTPINSTNIFKMYRVFKKLLDQVSVTLKVRLTKSSIALTKTTHKTSKFEGGDPSDFEF